MRFKRTLKQVEDDRAGRQQERADYLREQQRLNYVRQRKRDTEDALEFVLEGQEQTRDLGINPSVAFGSQGLAGSEQLGINRNKYRRQGRPPWA